MIPKFCHYVHSLSLRLSNQTVSASMLVPAACLLRQSYDWPQLDWFQNTSVCELSLSAQLTKFFFPLLIAGPIL